MEQETVSAVVVVGCTAAAALRPRTKDCELIVKKRSSMIFVPGANNQYNCT